MNEDQVLTPESVQSEIRRTRHRAELPMYAITIVLGIIAAIILYIYTFNDSGALEQIKDVMAGENIIESSEEYQSIFTILVAFVSMVGGVGIAVIYVVTYLVGSYKLYASRMCYGIRVSEKNYPEIYAKVKEFTELLGLKKEPEVYVQQSNGSVNAFASWAPGRTFIQLNAEVVDLGYMENKDFDTVAFIMAHEFGHIYFHHVHMHYRIWTTLIGYVPIVGALIISPLYSRSKEYTADRVAQALTGGKNQVEGMKLLCAGRHGYKYIDIQDYLENANQNYNILEKIARFVINMMASHPVTPYRIAAIMDETKKNGKLL